MIIWKKIEGENYLLPIGHVNQDKTDYSIYYNTVWDSLESDLQHKVESLFKEYSELKRNFKIIYTW